MVKKAASAPAPEPAAQPEQQPAAPAPEPAAPAAGEPPAPPAPAPTPEPTSRQAVDVEPLAVYAARIEEQGQPLPVCQITHPDAKDGAIHVGKYAGIRLVRGDTPAALLSDGSTI
jgi:hypothetical protein